MPAQQEIGAQAACEREPVLAGHVHVEHGDVRPVGAEQMPGRVAVRCFEHAAVGRRERHAHQLPHHGGIVGDEDGPVQDRDRLPDSRLPCPAVQPTRAACSVLSCHRRARPDDGPAAGAFVVLRSGGKLAHCARTRYNRRMSIIWLPLAPDLRTPNEPRNT